ncbi:MAG: SpoIIE family protein phosphatase, partial [Bacteroidales bacterium]|nr:SpoIIE family protein phosphatase [Bacteroidales bacterium]
NFWIAAGSSVLFYDGTHLDTIDSKNGLMAQQVYLLIIDNKNRLFVGTNKGLNRIDLTRFYVEKNIYIKQYGYMDGFMGKECNRNAVMKDSKGRLWFGTVKGLEVYEPQKDAVNFLKPSIFITGIGVNFKKPDWKLYASEMDSSTNLPINAVLPYTQNNLHFSFVSNSLKIPKKVAYKYQLNPIDNNWSPPFNKNELDFKSLPPNDYTLKIIAANDDGLWNDQPLVFSFTIKPPFYLTWWFITLAIVFVLVLIIVYIKAREKKLVKEKKILEGEVQKRTLEIVKQKEIVERKNKDITDSINYAQNIQIAILPNEGAIRHTLTDSFVFFRPKDVISGDFFWFTKHNGKIYITAAGCTGPGVPGALMSMLGMAFINELIHSGIAKTAAEFLNELRKNVIEALNQEDQTERKDGMDIAFCILDSENNSLNYAGANNPLYIVRDKNNPSVPNTKLYENEQVNLYEIKGDKKPVGLHIHQDRFTDHYVETEKTDYFYIFSDGFADQFGGPKGKKFKYSTLRNLLMEIHPLSSTGKKEKLKTVFLDWLGNLEQIDDVLIVGFRNVVD